MKIDKFTKIVYTISTKGTNAFKIYGKVGHTYELLCGLENTNKTYGQCLDIVLNKDIKSSLLNIRHKYKYMRRFCEVMLKCQCDVHHANQEERDEIQACWDFSDNVKWGYGKL